LILLLALAALAGCGGGDDDGAPEGKTVTAKVMTKLQSGVRAQVGQWVADIPVAHSEEPAFTVAEVIAPPGNLNLGLWNSSGEQHNLTIEEVGGGSIDTPFIRDGKAWIRSSLLEGKKYVFYCGLHRKEGMEGTIVVDPKLSAEDLKPYQLKG